MNAPIPVGVLDRATYIGGSDVAAILGVAPPNWNKTPFMLYQQKTGAFTEELTPAKRRILERGARWEPIVLEMAVDELTDRGHDVEVVSVNQRYKDPELPFLAAEIDAELIVDGEPVNGEMKTASYFAAGDWGDYDSNEVPIYYLAQVMHGLMIQPRRRTMVAAVTGFDDRPMIRWVERDDETIAAIREREIEFWERLQRGEPPDPDTPADVKWCYPRDLRASIPADDALIDAHRRLKAAKASFKALEADIELLATQIKARMGDAALLLGPNGKPLCSWKNNKDGTKTDWQAVAAEAGAGPDLIAKHTHATHGARPFLVK